MIAKKDLLDALESISAMHRELTPIYRKSWEALHPADRRTDPRALALASRYESAIAETEEHLNVLNGLIRQVSDWADDGF